MKRIGIALSALAAALACGCGPAPTKPAVGLEAGAGAGPPAGLIEKAKRSFVVVKVWYKKDTSEPASVIEDNWQVRQLCEEYVDLKRPREMPGLVLDGDGHILAFDDGVEDRFIGKIAVHDVAGKSFRARRDKLLHDAPGILLKVDAESASKLTPLKFAELKEKGIDTRLLQAVMRKVDDQWRIQVGPVRPAVRYAPGEPANVFFGYRIQSRFPSRYGSFQYGPGIVTDGDGAPVGCILALFMDLRQTECLWKGPDLLKADGIGWPQLSAARKKARAALTAAVQEVVIRLHEGGGSSDSSFSGPDRYRSRSGSGVAGRELLRLRAGVAYQLVNRRRELLGAGSFLPVDPHLFLSTAELAEGAEGAEVGKLFTTLRMPFFRTVTLKLSSRPTLQPESFR